MSDSEKSHDTNTELPDAPELTYVVNSASTNTNIATVEDIEDPKKQVDSKHTEKTEREKLEEDYTVLDELTGDKPLVYDGKSDPRLKPLTNPWWALMSVITPEGVMNTKLRTIKIRGIFNKDDYDLACTFAKELQAKDKYFNIFVGELWEWLPISSSASAAEESKYKNKKQQKLMARQRLNELNTLVKKKKTQIDKDNKSFQRSKADRIMTARNDGGVDSAVTDKSTKKREKHNQKFNSSKQTHGGKTNIEDNKARLRRVLAQRKKKKDKAQDVHKNMVYKKNKQKENLEKREKDLETKQNAANDIEDSLAKIQAYMNK